MENPWNTLSKRQPYILDVDQEWVLEYQKKLQKIVSRYSGEEKKNKIIDTYSLHTEDIPFPYFGNPHTAKVIVLQANPGHDSKLSLRPDYQDIMDLDYKNLFHLNTPGIYSMTPKYREWVYTDGTASRCWYWMHTRGLHEHIGLNWENVANKVLFMEYFPYRSKRLLYPDQYPESQNYTFYLLRELMKKKAYVIMTRMERFWIKAVPELTDYPYYVKHKNPRGVYLSKKNLGSDHFEAIIKLLGN